MSEQTFYRKYRPADFDEVIGQGHLIEVLAAAAVAGQLAHAYLFAGGRGTGKTSVARILARAAGCQPADLYEIDAASSRGIDEIRALREAVRTLPLNSPRKVYIVDEVHMLTKEAFNALLKTLEEPPEHVIFILATTEPHKVPATIASRCQVFTFRRPGLSHLREMVERVAGAEKIELEPAAVELIAWLADGSFRDAMVLLQQTAVQPAGGPAGGKKPIGVDQVSAASGAPSVALARQLAEALLKNDGAAGLAVVAEAAERQADIKTLIKMTLEPLRALLLSKLDPKLAPDLNLAAPVPAAIPIGDAKRLPDLIRGLLAAYEAAGQSVVPTLPLELAVVELTSQ